MTWNIYPADGASFTQHHPEGGASTVSLKKTDAGWRITASGEPQPHLLRVHLENEPSAVALDGRTLEKGADWRYDGANRRLWIRAREPLVGRYDVAAGKGG